ncbi:nicotinate-nucleotide adenylyltransferase [Erythrobacter sp. R86502]|uniref:nicotinate-nucleotide adenylyltransferase n=1 Tax=Erythrobacter sp. R86502 TaxID=3093846 RepID=UPI0036D322C5
MPPPPHLTGLLGGSFNPAHGGHRRITLFAAEALGLDETWWLVSPGNPLKPRAGMAPLAARLLSARKQARRARIVPTAIEQQLGTRYTAETLARLTRRYPRRRFMWLMGSDNLAQLHRWKDWRKLARTMPIAVIARPGYDGRAMTSPAMAWLRRYRVSAASIRKRGQWSAPALVLLRFDPDHRSATAIRRAHAGWADALLGQGVDGKKRGATVRDRLTFRKLRQEAEA